MVRLFTSGTHNGLSFNNTQITDIAAKTRQRGAERIPFVLGHPKNDLPVVGYLQREAVLLYHEADKTSIGFDREKASFSEESLNILREIGNNKISVRLEGGIIKHIGLVKKAAVAENNQQDLVEYLTGDYHTSEDFMGKPTGRFLNPLLFFKINKSKHLGTENENTRQLQPIDFSKLQEAALIHRGNTQGNTVGCILVGENMKKCCGLHSTPYENELTNRLKVAIAAGESCTIEIL